MTENTNKTAGRVLDPGFPGTFGEKLFNCALNEIYVFDPESFHFIAVNDAARTNLGYSMDELQNLKPWDLKTEMSEPDFRELIQPLLKGESDHLRFTAIHKRKDGSRYPVEVRLQHFAEEDQPVVMALAFDLSDQQADFDKLAKLANVAEKASNAIVICDGEGRVDWVNQAYVDLTGFELSEIKGKTPGSFLHGPETNPATIDYMKQHFLRGQGVRAEVINYHKSGRKYWVEVHIQPVCRADGTVEHYLAIESDITERKQAEDAIHKLNQRLEEEKERYELAVRGSDNGLWDWDIQSNTVHYSSRFRELLGYAEEEFPNKLESFSAIVHPDDTDRAGKVVADHLRDRTPYDLQYRLKTKSGAYRWFRAKAQALWDENGNATRLAGSIADVSEHKRTEEAIKRLAKTDALTGLPNRTLFHERLKSALANAKRLGTKVGLMLLDLDHFKNINDTLGHPAGDAFLCEVARRILHCVRETDTVARLGGDEFAIVATNLNEGMDIDLLANRIVTSLAEPFSLEGQKVHSGASIGITIFPESTGNSDDLLRNADIALYEAKESGRGVYRLYDSAMNKHVQARRLIERDLRHAMENGDLELFYQPQISLAGMRVVGAEALLRWKHTDRGLIRPSEFIPVAEATRLIIPLGEWVINTACEQNKNWQDQGLPPIVVAVNVSPLQFKHQDMLPNLRKALSNAQLDPQWLEVEITEAVAMDKNSVNVLQDLKDIGVKLAIDDFGTGYSSLSRLKNFPVDRLKIDRSFVRAIETQWDHGAIGTAIIQLGHSLNLNVIAEGVETIEELDHLTHMGCDDVQGFLLAPAMPANEFAEFLKLHSTKFDLELAADKPLLAASGS